MWIEIKPKGAPKELLLFGPGGIIAVSPGAIGSVLVFSGGHELDVEDGYATLREKLSAS